MITKNFLEELNLLTLKTRDQNEGDLQQNESSGTEVETPLQVRGNQHLDEVTKQRLLIMIMRESNTKR